MFQHISIRTSGTSNIFEVGRSVTGWEVGGHMFLIMEKL